MMISYKDTSDLKNNIFEHVLYEFEMYLDTYSLLIKLNNIGALGQFSKNVLIESHLIHLRNLMEFFTSVGEDKTLNSDPTPPKTNASNSRNQNDINIKTIFTADCIPTIRDESHMKQTVNRALSHLSKDRYRRADGNDSHRIKVNDAILEMYRRHIPERIMAALELLHTESHVNKEFIEHLKDDRIQNRILILQKRLDRTREIQ